MEFRRGWDWQAFFIAADRCLPDAHADRTCWGCSPRSSPWCWCSRGRSNRARPPRVQVGLASWYGPGFHGEETASGEIFDQREMVAAHRTLPLGSVIRVTNLENGRRVTLRVIDRGPYGRNFRKGTIVDVSRGAARRLRMVRDGLVKVRIEVRKLGCSMIVRLAPFRTNRCRAS